jgi:hypothetical protein
MDVELALETLSALSHETRLWAFRLLVQAGRSIRYQANYATVRELVLFLMEDCCAGNSAVCRPVAESLGVNA